MQTILGMGGVVGLILSIRVVVASAIHRPTGIEGDRVTLGGETELTVNAASGLHSGAQ